MNIGIVTTWFPAGGGYVSKAYREILSGNHNVLIYARGGKKMKGDPIWDDEQVTWAPKHYNSIKTKQFVRWAKRNKIDVLFFNEQRYWKPVVAAKKAGFCIGAYIDYYKQSTVEAFALYDFLICNTKRHFYVFEWHENAFYVPWGTKILEKTNTRSRDQPVKFLVSSGREGSFNGDRRGTLIALDAFRNVTGNCELLLYSQVPINKCSPQFQEKVNRDNRINFIEGTFEPFPYEEGDVYLYPSKLDGIGLTLPEALGHGLPAITTNNPPMNEFVIEGINGFLVNVVNYLGREDGYYWAESLVDVDHLTKLMQNLVDKGHSFLNEMKKTTLNHAKAYLNWEENAKGVLNIFENAQINKKQISSNLVDYALNLDKVMAPTYAQRVLSLIKSYLVFKLN